MGTLRKKSKKSIFTILENFYYFRQVSNFVKNSFFFPKMLFLSQRVKIWRAMSNSEKPTQIQLISFWPLITHHRNPAFILDIYMTNYPTGKTFTQRDTGFNPNNHKFNRRETNRIFRG